MDTKVIENVNYSELGRELNKDPRTIKKWIYRDENKPIKTTRNKPSQFDEYKDIIMELLESKIKRFYKKRCLFKYLINKYDIKCSESSFRAYILKNQEINDKFKNIVLNQQLL